MKTAYSITEIEQFLSQKQPGFILGSVTQLTEGHTSQVFSFDANQQTYVLRIRMNKKDFDADVFAYQNFSSTLPIPEVLEIGSFDDETFFAITPYISGETLNTLSSDSFEKVITDVKEVIAKTFQADVSSTTGYGDPDFQTGNATATTWKEALENELDTLDVNTLHQHAANISLPEDAVGRLVEQFESNLEYVSEQRRLLHGDPGGDNVIVNDTSVIALLDWEQMAYGDWLRDFSRFEFWSKNNYGDVEEFAHQYNLEAEHIHERKAVYWAINALRAIEFADVHSSKKVANWLKANLERILI